MNLGLLPNLPPWGHPLQESQNKGVSGPGKARQEVELSTSVTGSHVTSQAGRWKPGLQLRTGCQVLEKGLRSTAVAAPGGITKKWVRMVLVNCDHMER